MAIDPQRLAMLLAHGAGAGQAHQEPMQAGPLQAITGHMGAQPEQQENGLQELQDAIQAVHEAILAAPDPAHTQMLAQALAILTRVQRELMQPATGGAGRAAGQLRGQ